MVPHFFKVFWRNLSRNKLFMVINTFGLSIGLAGVILITIVIGELLRVDQFHEKKDRLYSVYQNEKSNGRINTFRGTPSLLGPYVTTNYTGAEEVVRIFYASNFLFHVGHKHLEAQGILADRGFLSAFTFPLVYGDPKTALDYPDDVVLTESFARKLFGTTDVLGQSLRIDSNANFRVTGVAKDLPSHSMVRFDYLLPYGYRKRIGWEVERWDDYYVETYVLLNPGTTLTNANQFFRNVLRANSSDATGEFFLYPFSKSYLYGDFENGRPVGGGIDFVKKMSWIGVFILLIACINYINLSTARAIRSAREVGIRKLIGASRLSLVTRYVSEAMFIAAFAAVIALGIAQLLIPSFSGLVTMETHFIPYTSPWFWLTFVACIVVTGIASGLYPAFILSAYQPVNVLKGTINNARSPRSPRKFLVVFQFTFAIVFMICTAVVYRQIKLGQQFNTGYNQDNLVYIFLRGDLNKNYEVFRRELMNTGAVESVTRTHSPVTQTWISSDQYSWTGKNEKYSPIINEYRTDVDFVSTMGVKLLAGRDIDITKYADDSSAILLNKTAAHIMGFDNPVGQILRKGNDTWKVVGVVDDFITDNPYAPVVPTIIQGPKYDMGTVSFRLNPKRGTASSLNQISKLLNKYNTDYPSTFVFVDEDYQLKFRGSKNLGQLNLLFASLSIFISCLGLYGLAVFMAHSRVKEIGIRKVLGASVISIATLLSRDYLRLVLISIVVGSPIAWWMMQSWLQQFTSRITISWWMFGITGLAAVTVAMLTVGYHALKAAMANPVKNLRNE